MQNKSAHLDIMKLFSTCLKGLEARGITVEETSDFELCERRMKSIGKHAFTPMLSSEYNDLSKDHAVWLMLKQTGLDIGGVAARCDNLVSETLSGFWQRSYKRLYKGEGQLDPRYSPSPASDEIKGKVVYMGEFFITKHARGSRHLLSLYTHLLFAYCQLRWRSDWLYAFIRADDVRRGYASEYGFTRQYPGAQNWAKMPNGRVVGEYLVAIPSVDLCDTARYFQVQPTSLLGVDSLTRVE